MSTFSSSMTAAQEKAFEKKAENHFKSQRELLLGRDFRWNKPHWHCKQDDQKFRENFDKIFPNAPGAGF